MFKRGTSRGEPRRNKTPTVDLTHLEDAIISHVRHEGVAASFRMGKYMELSTAQAAVGSSLLDLAGLIQKLALVSPSMEFKYTDLKTAVAEALKQFPGVKDKFTIAQQSELPKLLGEALLVECAHCRRLVRDKKKFEEAASKMSLQQVQSLKELMQKIGAKCSESMDVEDTGPEELEGTPAKKKRSESPIRLSQFEVPETPKSSKSDSLLAEAREAEPVPVRKRAIRAALKRPAAAEASAQPAPLQEASLRKRGSVTRLEPAI